MKKRSDDEITKKQVLNTIIIIAHDAALIWCVFVCVCVRKKRWFCEQCYTSFGYNLNQHSRSRSHIRNGRTEIQTERTTSAAMLKHAHTDAIYPN